MLKIEINIFIEIYFDGRRGEPFTLESIKASRTKHFKRLSDMVYDAVWFGMMLQKRSFRAIKKMTKNLSYFCEREELEEFAAIVSRNISCHLRFFFISYFHACSAFPSRYPSLSRECHISILCFSHKPCSACLYHAVQQPKKKRDSDDASKV